MSLLKYIKRKRNYIAAFSNDNEKRKQSKEVRINET